MREKKEVIIEKVKKAIQYRPKTISDLRKELGKEEKVIRICLQDLSNDILINSIKTSGRIVHVFQLKVNNIPIQNTTLNNNKVNKEESFEEDMSKELKRYDDFFTDEEVAILRGVEEEW
jgi:hypothetical protein